MSISDSNKLNFCLREARKAKGFSNAGQASTAVPYSQETIGRHERGDVQLSMEDVINYATGYESPALMLVYCSECPIRNALMGKDRANPLGIPISAIRVSNRLRKAAKFDEELATILDDGMITDDEVPFLRDVMIYLRQVEEVSRELLFGCMNSGLYQKLKKHPQNESAAYQNHSSQQLGKA